MTEEAPESIPPIGGRRPVLARGRFWLAYRLLRGQGFAANLTLVLPPGAAIEKNTTQGAYLRSCLLAKCDGHQTIPGTLVVSVRDDGAFVLHR